MLSAPSAMTIASKPKSAECGPRVGRGDSKYKFIHLGEFTTFAKRHLVSQTNEFRYIVIPRILIGCDHMLQWWRQIL